MNEVEKLKEEVSDLRILIMALLEEMEESSAVNAGCVKRALERFRQERVSRRRPGELIGQPRGFREDEEI